ncbi:MAG TPA: O-antigen ligase family protein, partial [Acidimicrobiia bacterium]|nr:O-antigen ligase family protein [Acidimicrobiia bacterium]
MATTGATLHPGFSTRVRPRSARLPYAWPLYALFGLFPLWWVLGFGAFIWPVMAGPMLLSLLSRRTVRVPRGYGLYLLFMIWMLASATQLNGPDRLIGFIFRALLYSSVAVCCLYVFNATKEQLPTSTVVKIMAVFWGVVVAGGLLGIVAPELEFTTLAERLVPGRLLANEYVYTLVHPTTAQIQVFLGYPVPRPRAPFVYTNDWGGTYALLVPFVLAAWAQVRSLARRNLLRLVAIVSLLPVVFSLNRILWLCLVVAVVYGSTRFAIRGRAGGFQGILALVGVVFLIFTFGPTRQLIDDRVNTPHSNQGRTILYKEAADSVGRSPMLGYGAPRPSQANPNLPSVGTQGQFWLVLFSHGIPGALFFTSFLGYAAWRTRRARTATALWCHVVVLLALVQMPFYGLLSAQLHIIAIAIALAAREEFDPDPGPTATPAI